MGNLCSAHAANIAVHHDVLCNKVMQDVALSPVSLFVCFCTGFFSTVRLMVLRRTRLMSPFTYIGILFLG